MRASGICGAANSILAHDGIGSALHRRQIPFVPDIIASAGAVVDGIGRSVMNIADPLPLIDALGAIAAEVLAASERADTPPQLVAEERAAERLRGARHEL